MPRTTARPFHLATAPRADVSEHLDRSTTDDPPSERQRGSRNTLVVAGAAGLTFVVVLVIGLRLTRSETSSTPTLVYGISHVHGLGINPADASLIVATHNGTFRLAPNAEQAERVSDDLQDTMGFTVIGPNQFLGSGHPDLPGLRAGQPEQLGVVESSDGGATWTVLALGGEADFHGLAAAHGQIYGWDARRGRFMVSADRVEWETRSTVDIVGFAVDPEDRDHIVAAGPRGLLDSTDGGSTWATVDGPVLSAVSWDGTGGLWGLSSDGSTYHYSANGWARAGSLPGEPAALLVTAETLYAAATGDANRTGIYRSNDGVTWSLIYEDPSP